MADFQEDVSFCARVIKNGGIILYPTDTVWGIGCNALDTAAVDKIFALKQRPKNKSLILLLAEIADLVRYTSGTSQEIVNRIQTFTEPTTVIFKAAKELPANVINEDGTVAIRLTRDPFCRALIQEIDVPLVSTSANVSGAPAAALYAEIDLLIIEGVDYVVHHRRDDQHRVAPSRIVRFEEDGTLTYLR